MSKMKVHFSSETDDWATPQKTFDTLNAEFGPFDFDACASKSNAKCEVYLGKDLDYDGLLMDWKTDVVRTDFPKIWMNPPYGRHNGGIGAWIKKASEEASKGCLVVCLLPARTDTKWFHTYIYNRDNVYLRFLPGRLKFGGAKNSAPFPSMVVVFHPGGVK